MVAEKKKEGTSKAHVHAKHHLCTWDSKRHRQEQKQASPDHTSKQTKPGESRQKQHQEESSSQEFSTPRPRPRPRRPSSRRQPPRSPSRGLRDPHGPRQTRLPPCPHRHTSAQRRAWRT